MIQIACNAVSAKLMNADRDTKLTVTELLSYFVEGAEYTEAYTSHRWDGRSSFFSFKDGVFPAGFVPLVRRKLKALGHEVQVIRGRLPAPLGPEHVEVDTFGPDPRYDYQMETVDNLLRFGQMVAQIATGGGKSRIAKMAVARIRRPTLFLTTRSVLMYQMKAHFEDAGFKCGVMGDGEWSLRKGVNVGMVQTINARLEDLTTDVALERYFEALKTREDKALADAPASKRAALKKWLVGRRPSDVQLAETIEKKVAHQAIVRPKMIKTLQYFEFVILEEAHEAGSNSFFDIMRQCRNAHYRLSLTATPFMKTDAEANMRLMACSGPIGIRVVEKRLIDSGILATPSFKFVSLPKPEGLYVSTGWQRAYKLGITDNQSRNTHIVYEAARAAKLGLSTMVLVQRKKHGQCLKEMLTAAGVRVRYIYGDHDQATRASALKALQDGKIDVLIGTNILDVGVDVPAVGMIIIAGGGKAEVGYRQRIGRGLRAKAEGPNVAYIVDFADGYNRHLRDHAKLRRAIIDATPGFAENVLAPGSDFDFSRHRDLSEAV